MALALLLWNRRFRNEGPHGAHSAVYAQRPRPHHAVADNVLLLDYLREIVGLTGTKTGCDGGANAAPARY